MRKKGRASFEKLKANKRGSKIEDYNVETELVGGAYYLINFFNCAALLAKKSSKSSNNFNDTAKTRDFLLYKKNY